MKKISALTLVLLLTAAVLAGCRSTAAPMAPSSEPTQSTVTKPTTAPTTEATVPSTEASDDVTTTPTDGMTDPGEFFNDNGMDANPSTGDQARGRGINTMR